ncbi:hypothetical protein [Natronoflexus pectinivorans]|uniref:Uncharacterized protein n=1 Tax=Natronoflexus pectinivorans TaxID=682526 RepID=A0A4R2GGL3_9BACT|nr:hypothetical protein [Natronoflexus pectinivorans]TCO07428.1 hypothetical protein EV194_10833 [Natronoflexus pectinivorans]
MKKIYHQKNDSSVRNIFQRSWIFSGIIALIIMLLSSVDVFGNYVSISGRVGDYEDNSNWNPSSWGMAYPPEDGNVDKAMTISSNSTITRNGNLNPVTVTVNGTFKVYGDYANNQWGGVTVENGGRLEIFGNLTGSAAIDVKNNGVLIVHGNLESTGASVNVHGNLVVAGSFSTSSSTTIRNTGKLVVGGDFTHHGGGLNTQGNNDTKIYIINPDAVITAPGWSIIDNPNNYGDLEEFNDKESGELKDIVEAVVVPVFSGFQWVGNKGNNEWENASNWTGNRLPNPTSNVRIKASNDNPKITLNSGLVEVNDLLVESGAILTLKLGARLTVHGNLTIQDEGGLVLENSYEQGGMASLITHGQIAGHANVKLVLPKEKWYYLGSVIRDATFGNFSPGDQGSGTLVNVYRDRWYSTFTQHYETAMRKLEGVAVFYHKTSESDDLMEITYTGELNSGEISRTFAENRFQLMANPFPSFINWLDDAGWERENFESTIWYRTKIGESMTYVTFNRSAVPGARVSLFSDKGEYTEEEMSLIPPKQSFFVRPMGENRTITVNNRARVHGLPESQLKSSNNAYGDVIRITADNGLTRDGAVIYFSRNASEGIDEGDSEKYRNTDERVPEIFTRVGETELAINGLPELNQPTRTIPLVVRNRVSGDVTLTFDMSYYYGMHSVYLEDRDTGAFIHVTVGGEYVYTVSEPGERDDRFVLHFYMVSTDLEPEMEDPKAAAGIRINGVAGKALVSIDSQLLQMGEANIEVFSIEGQKVSETLARSSRTLVVLPRTSAIFIVRVTAGDVVKSERVVGVR